LGETGELHHHDTFGLVGRNVVADRLFGAGCRGAYHPTHLDQSILDVDQRRFDVLVDGRERLLLAIWVLSHVLSRAETPPFSKIVREPSAFCRSPATRLRLFPKITP